MTRKTNVHVVPRGNHQRAVVKEGSKRASAVVDTQKMGIQIAKPIAIQNKSDVIVHKPTGPIRERNSYGHDPYPPKG